MDKYELPKGMKIKKKKMPKVKKMAEESEAGLGSVDSVTGQAKPAKTEGQSLVEKPKLKIRKK
jgi:hypothetical protein